MRTHFSHILAMAFAGGEIDNDAIAKIKDICKLNDFYKKFDDMFDGIEDGEDE